MKINDIITETAKRPGLWANIHAKQKRIKSGSGEHMRKPGSKGAPSDHDLKASRTEAVDAGQKRLGPDKNDPWEQGWSAAHRRQDESACPYERGSKEYSRWMDGYDEGAAQPNHYDESVEAVTEDRELDKKILRLFTFSKSPEQIADELNIDIDASISGDVQMSIYSITGIMVMNSKTIKLEEGRNTINENISNLSNGLYIVRLVDSSNKEVMVKKLMKN
jgi:hypothetical protein